MTTSNRVEFTTEMKRDYTILVPNMAPIHFGLLRNVFINYGYRMEILQNDGRAVVDAGLKYVHNDICYPALLVCKVRRVLLTSTWSGPFVQSTYSNSSCQCHATE